MSSQILRRAFFIALIVAFSGWSLHAQESEFEDFDDIGDDIEFSEEEFDDVDFDDVEFEDFSEEDFADEDFEIIDDSEFEEFDGEALDEEFAEEPPIEADELEAVEELQFDDLPDDPIAEDPFDVDPLEEDFDLEAPVTDDLSPPAVVEEDLFSEPPTTPDEPDLDYEARLHDIYVRFHKEKTSDEDWFSIVGQRITEVYVIQKNDKLWEISETLFGDGNYWPKIWSLNSRIRNPHLIRPNNRIQFVLGDESGPPAFTITEEVEEVGPGDTVTEVVEVVEIVEEAPEQNNQPEIPPPLVTSRPVVKRLPPSLPKWQVFGEQGEFDELGIDYGKRKIVELDNKTPLSAYVSERKVEPIGRITEVEAGNQIASTLQYLYVEMDMGTAQVGDTLLVVRDRGAVEKAHSSIDGFLGYSVEVQGEIQLVERVPRVREKKSRRRRRRGNTSGGGELYRAIVSRLVNPVNVGSVIVPGRIQMVEISEQGPKSQVVAQIVGGQFFNRRRVYGAESVAYINRGSNDGVEVGQIMSVRENRKIRNRDTLVRTNVRPIGWLKVVDVEPNLATVIVVRAWSDILTGDITGAGEYVSRIPEEGAVVPGDEILESRSLLEELDELGSSYEANNQTSGEDDFDDIEEGELDEEFIEFGEGEGEFEDEF